jgi:hypothetical protein
MADGARDSDTSLAKRRVVKSWALCGAPLVPVMETADFGDRDNPSGRRRLDRSAIGRVLFQPEMRSTFMVIRDIFRKHASQMRLAEDDDVIQTLAPHGSDQSGRRTAQRPLLRRLASSH